MSLTLISPSLTEELQITEPYMVVIFNDDTTPFETVIDALVRATGCTMEEAELETWEAHHCGKASVHYASREECQDAAEILASAGITVEVRKEWLD